MNRFRDLHRVFANQLVKAVGLVALLSMGPFIGVRNPSEILDYDLWWHLRVGDWIRANHSLPQVGLFSQYGADKPWAAYSWGGEVFVSVFYEKFGLLGVCVLRYSVEVAITFAIFVLLYRLSGRFWASLLLTGFGLWAIYHNLAYRPVLATIFFYTVMLLLILEAQVRRSMRPLYFLLLVFLLWPNFHIQFIYGLFVVALFTAVEIGKGIATRLGTPAEPEALPLMRVVAVAIACVLATLVLPYGFTHYKVILELARSKAIYSQITELAPLSFRSSAHFFQLLLVVFGFYALGVKSRDVFRLLLMVIAAVVAFRTTRDSWFVCIPAMAMIALGLRTSTFEQTAAKARMAGKAAGVLAAVVVVVFALMRDAGLNEAALQAEVVDFFPVRSADFIRASHLPGPLYNNLNFGGFLLWYLPEHPVAIDGRSDVYSDEYYDRYYGVLTGTRDAMQDPDLRNAKTVVLQKGYALTKYLFGDPRFQAVFEDSNSVVFVRY